MSLDDLYPSSTSICDFAYDENHPLRQGHFVSGTESWDSSDSNHSDSFPLPERYENPSSELRAMNLRAVALFAFTPENDNEIQLAEGQIVWISYRHGQGWLVAEDPVTGKNGLVPEEYVDFLIEDEDVEDDPRPFMPEILRLLDKDKEDEWEDLEEEETNVPTSRRLSLDDTEIKSIQHQLQTSSID